MAKTATTRVGVVLDQQRGEHRHVGVRASQSGKTRRRTTLRRGAVG